MLPVGPRPVQLLVGSESLDDAAVWRVSDELAIVHTIDFFTPIVDDARTFGRIAATNAMSDVYAMGGRPAFALNVVAFPKQLPMELLGEILAGGGEVAAAAGAVIAGGHSIDDAEPKYGMAVIGFVHPDQAAERVKKLIIVGDNRLKQGGVDKFAKARGTFQQALRLAEEAGIDERFRPFIERRLESIEQLAGGG